MFPLMEDFNSARDLGQEPEDDEDDDDDGDDENDGSQNSRSQNAPIDFRRGVGRKRRAEGSRTPVLRGKGKQWKGRRGGEDLITIYHVPFERKRPFVPDETL